MNIIEEIWNVVYLRYNVAEIIKQEEGKGSDWFKGYGKNSPYICILDNIKKTMLTEFNQKELASFIEKDKIKIGYSAAFDYYMLDYVLRNVIFEEKQSNFLLDIIIKNTIESLKNVPYANNEGMISSFIENINKILHKFKKAYLEGIIVSIDTPLQELNLAYALEILNDNIYGTTKKEYENALTAYEQHDFKKSIIECNSAFESLLKCTCEKYSIKIEKKDSTVNKLVDILKNNNYFKEYSYIATNINHLIGLLDSGANTIRNKSAGHGGGMVTNDPDEIISKLALDMTTSYIVFFAKLNKRISLPPINKDEKI